MPVIRSALRIVLIVAAAGVTLMAYVWVTLPDVRPLATSNPTTTAFMELRAREAQRDGRTLRHVQRWMPYTRISHNLKRAVLVAEDDAFWDHDGIDVEQIKKSIEVDLRGGSMRGGSTITQQLAKNLYLSPSRDPLRKLRELIIARRLEAELPKARIFEIYLNVIEWGDGIWGADAAARTYFGVSAASLSREQAALLAGAIINPRMYSPAKPPARLLRRQRIILSRMGSVEPPAPPSMPIAPPLPYAPESAPEQPLSPPSEDAPIQESTPDELSAPSGPAEPLPQPSPQQ